MSVDHLPQSIREVYEVHEWKHACAILYGDFPNEFQDLIDVLGTFKLKKSWIATAGGSKSKVAAAIDSEFYARGWVEKDFSTRIMVDKKVMDTPFIFVGS